MINKKFSKNLFLVFLSNGIRLVSSIVSMFLIPIIFSQQHYGFYKLFLMYISYAGIFHFGFIEGIYLYYAGKDYDDLPKSTFRTFSKFLVFLEIVMSLLIFGLSFLFTGQKQIIVMLVSINIMFLNLTAYYQYISQVTQRFKEFLVINTFYVILNLLLIGSFFIFNISDYVLFLIFTTIINFTPLIWYLFRYHEISFGKSNGLTKEKDNISLMFKLGIPLLSSNFIAVFVTNIPKQFVESKYPIENYPDVFANFSFAFTLLSFANVFLTAVSIVLYPTLKKSNEDELKKSYGAFNAAIIVVTFISISAYFPSVWIVNRFLPSYTDALKYFFILAPGLAITSAITVIKHNYYKTFNMNNKFLISGIIVLIVMLLGVNAIYFIISKEVIYIAIFTVVVQLLWYVLTEEIMIKKIQSRSYKNYIYILVASLLFYGTLLLNNNFLSLIMYMVSILILTLLIYWKEFKILIKKYLLKNNN